VTADGRPPLIQAKEDGKRNDVKQGAITVADDAIITVVSGGIRSSSTCTTAGP
jgi:hypothetical protein